MKSSSTQSELNARKSKMVKAGLIGLTLLLFLILVFWSVLNTTLGLKSLLALATQTLPGKFQYENVHGTLHHRAEISNIHYRNTDINIQIQKVTFEKTTLHIQDQRLEIPKFYAEKIYIQPSTLSHPIELSKISGRFQSDLSQKNLILQINALEGQYQGEPLTGTLDLHIQNETLSQLVLDASLGQNKIGITPADDNFSIPKDSFIFTLINPNIDNHKVSLQGWFSTRDRMQTWIGELLTATWKSPWTEPLALQKSAQFKINKESFSLGPLMLSDKRDGRQGKITLQLNIDKNKGSKVDISIPYLSIRSKALQTNIQMDLAFQSSPGQALKGHGNLIILPGRAKIELPGNKYYESQFNGGRLAAEMRQENLHLDLFFTETSANKFKAQVLLPHFSLPTDLNLQRLSGNISAQIQDPTLIYLLVPEISRLKSTLEFTGEIGGTLKDPTLQIDSNLRDTIFSIPKLRITVKEVSAQLRGKLPGPLTLKATGTLGGNPFNIEGQLEPMKLGAKHQLLITGEHLKIVNTPNLHIIADPNLNLVFVDNSIYITGSVKIPEANILLKDHITQANTSSDVIFIGQKPKSDLIESLKLMPSITLQLPDEDNVRFSGFGLDAIVRGELAIDRRQDGMFTAKGRLTIKEGKYRLKGSPYHIHRGHLLYTPGTLLNDPILDIRVAQRQPGSLTEMSEVGIYVQGTLQNPLFHLYSTDQMQSNDIIHRLGIGGKQSESDDNSRLLTLLTANPFVEKIQDKFGLEELNIQSAESQRIMSNLGSFDSVLVVGKSLSKRVYLQYIQGLVEPMGLLRLKYFLTPSLAVGVETSTREDIGGDISFTTERN